MTYSSVPEFPWVALCTLQAPMQLVMATYLAPLVPTAFTTIMMVWVSAAPWVAMYADTWQNAAPGKMQLIW